MRSTWIHILKYVSQNEKKIRFYYTLKSTPLVCPSCITDTPIGYNFKFKIRLFHFDHHISMLHPSRPQEEKIKDHYKRFRRLINTTSEHLQCHSLICEHFHAPWEMSILSNVRRCFVLPLVAGFLEMFAGVPYNREKNESLLCTPSCVHTTLLAILHPTQATLIL